MGQQPGNNYTEWVGRRVSFCLCPPHQPQERTLPGKRKAGWVASFPRLLGHCLPETSIWRHLEIARNKRGQAVSISCLLGVFSGLLCRGLLQPSSLRISATSVDAVDPHSFHHWGSWHGTQETALQKNTTALPLRKQTASTADADAPADFTAEGPPDFSIHRLQLPELQEPRPGVRHNLSTRNQPPLLQLSACTGSVQDHALASVLRARPVSGLHYQCPQVTSEATPPACHQPHILSLASTARFMSAAGLCSPTSVHQQSGPLLSL